MAATYVPDATAHGLSTEAQALDGTRLSNEILVAEEVLGLTGISTTGDDLSRGKVAVARQVNLQVRVAADPDVIAEGRGRQSVTYATVGGVRIPVDPTAKMLAEAVRKAAGFVSPLRSGGSLIAPTW